MYGTLLGGGDADDAAPRESPIGTMEKVGPWAVCASILVASAGSGVLSLPDAAHQGSLFPTIAVVVLLGACSSLAIYYTGVASGLHRSVSYAEVCTIAIFGPDAHPSSSPAACEASVVAASPQEDGRPVVLPMDVASPAADGSDDLLVRRGEADERARARRQWRLVLEFIVDFMVNAYNILGVVPFVRTIADLTPVVAVHYGASPTGILAQHTLYFGLVFAALIPVGALRSLNELFIVNILGAGTVVVVLIAIVVDFAATNGGEGLATDAQRDQIRWFELDSSFMVMPPIVLSALAFHNLLPQFAREMKDFTPTALGRVGHFSTAFIAASYTTAAIFGYLTFGSAVADAKADGSVINNYPSDTLWTMMRVMLLLHFVCALPVWVVNTRVSVCEMYERAVHGTDDDASEAVFNIPLRWRLLQSFVISVLIVGMSMAASDIATVLAWGGAFIGPMMVLFLPAAVAYSVHGGQWAGTRPAVDSGDAAVYEPWPVGRWLAGAAFLLAIPMQVFVLLYVGGVFHARGGAPAGGNSRDAGIP